MQVPSGGVFWLIPTVAAGILAFLFFLYYWGLDSKTESYDEECREDIRDHPAFRGIRRSSQPEIIATSDTRSSKAFAQLKKYHKSWTDKPHKVVVVGDQSFDERKKEVIFENCKEVRGKNLLQDELLASLRNYFAYKLAIVEEGPDSDITNYFKSRFEEYEYSQRINVLAKEDHHKEISVRENQDRKVKPLDDVFLPILGGAERHCVEAATGLEEREKEIERCKEFMMWLFFGLYIGEVKGAVLEDGVEQDSVEDCYRTDIRDRDNRGYWLLPESSPSESEFGKFKNTGWTIKGILNNYWGDDNYSELYPQTRSIPDMEYVERPFIVFRKNLEVFNGGPVWERVKGKEKYRRKEEHRT